LIWISRQLEKPSKHSIIQHPTDSTGLVWADLGHSVTVHLGAECAAIMRCSDFFFSLANSEQTDFRNAAKGKFLKV
jgi:hypothetical protein